MYTILVKAKKSTFYILQAILKFITHKGWTIAFSCFMLIFGAEAYVSCMLKVI